MGCANAKEQYTPDAAPSADDAGQTAPPAVAAIVGEDDALAGGQDADAAEQGAGDDTGSKDGGMADDLGWIATDKPALPHESVVSMRAKLAVATEARKTRSLERPEAEDAECGGSMKVQILIEGKWRDCDPDDNRSMCEHLAKGEMSFTLEARGQTYFIDFKDSSGGGYQTNQATQKRRKLRIIDDIDEGADESNIDPDRPPSAPNLTPSASSTGRTSSKEGGADPHLDGSKDPAVTIQIRLGPQSKRGNATQGPFSVLKDHPHAQECFQQFRKNEERLCGEFAVFYHSYSFAALIYEVHAAVGSVLFRFRSQYSSLPRILVHDFNEIPDARTLMDRFSNEFATNKRDHHPAFRRVGISVMCSLMSTGPEACIPMVFIAGYSCKDLSFRGVLENLLKSCYVPESKIRSLADDIIALSEKHGLDVSQFGGQPCASGKAGHLLQIFLKRKLVDRLAYAAKPYGPIDEARMPLSAWMDSDQPFSVGQARIVAHPKYFMQANNVRMYVASADPTFHRNRQAFQKDLTGLLNVILGEPSLRQAAATGIYGGSLPSWWTDEDQRTKW